jgi:hypothetical protein
VVEHCIAGFDPQQKRKEAREKQRKRGRENEKEGRKGYQNKKLAIIFFHLEMLTP